MLRGRFHPRARGGRTLPELRRRLGAAVGEKVLQVLSKTCGEWVDSLAHSSELRIKNADVRRARCLLAEVFRIY